MKNKYLKNTLITVSIYGLLVLFAYFGLGFVLGKNYSDYLNQHTMFLDFIRQNFWASGDFFPQWNMNYGLGQSFVIMFYYGMYNPFVLITYLFPAVNPVFAFEFIFAIVLGLNTLAMTKLLELNKIEGRLNTAISVLSSFSGIFLFQMATHPMFIYYLPIMTMSLVALHYLVDNQRKSYYSVTVALIFFTNFTFAPIISVLQFFYFTTLLVEANKFNIKNYLQFIKAYITGVLCGMMILLPTFMFMMQSSSRDDINSVKLDIFSSYEKIISSIGAEAYVSGIFIIGLFALLGTLYINRRRKYLIMLLPMVLILIFEPLNYAFNLFEYVHDKVYIMYLPLWWLMFAEVVKKGNKKNLAVITVASTILYTLGVLHKLSIIYIVAIIIGSLLVYGLAIAKSRIQYIVVCGLLIAMSILFSIRVSSRTLINDYKNVDGETPTEMIPYRELEVKNNYINSIYSQAPNVYTSLENANYIQATRLEYEVPITSYVRQTKEHAFTNVYAQNLYGISNRDVDVNPIVYGVNNEDVYSIDQYQQLDANEKLYALNQGVFVENSDNMSYENKFDLKPIYSSDKAITITKDLVKRFDIPTKYQNGVLNISFDSDIANNPKSRQKIEINGRINEVMVKDRYGPNENSHLTYRITTKDVEQLKINTYTYEGKSPITYTNFKVSYQPLENFEQNKIEVIEPTSFEVDLNDSYSFNLKMDTDGYLATTIPYDPGFKIYVDDVEVPVEKIENLFIGTKLSAGEHRIVIKYNIPGFKLGLVVSAIGWLTIVYFYIKERKQAKSK